MEVLPIEELQVNNHVLNAYDDFPPHIIKYMGSKRNILPQIVTCIESVYSGNQTILDLFAGTSILSGSIGRLVPVHSNDIQEYSSLLSHLYLANHEWVEEIDLEVFLQDFLARASEQYEILKNHVIDIEVNYDNVNTLIEFNILERRQQALVERDFPEINYHLFTKNYSGTYWSLEQCIWIDSIKCAADQYEGQPIYYALMGALMFAMAYNSQSTGHYAQFRDANDENSMKDILTYRKKEIFPLFKKKFVDLAGYLRPNRLNYQVTTLDYNDCLENVDENTIVYADPPYCFVHYSRFYHALETLVKYDYPDVLHKGRYRTDRHQSPFCQKTNVEDAFRSMFRHINRANAKLVLSYCNTGMITLERLEMIAREEFNQSYFIRTVLFDHQHSTMGRKADKNRDVQECLLTMDNDN